MENLPFFLLGLALVCCLTAFRASSAGSGTVDSLHLQLMQYGYLFLSGSSLLLIMGVYIPTVSAVRSLLHLDFSAVPGLVALALGVLAGVAGSIHFVRAALRKHRLPCSAGLIVLAEPIYRMIYPNAPQGYELLQRSAVGMIFVALNQTITGSLQGLGKVSVLANALLFGVAAKVTLNLILIRIPAVNIYGAPIASAVCYLIASASCFFARKKELPFQTPAGNYLWKQP